jgi:homoserine O-succinyltransferase
MNATATVLALRSRARQARPPQLTIGLLNNMPDAALAATERQFAGLLAGAADGATIELRLFSLAGVRRCATTHDDMAGRYQPAEALPAAGLDGLIVTGCEPRAVELEDEPYWPALARVIDWTAAASMPTIWSCLAAHAAVLRLDGVQREPLAAKLSGVFESRPVRQDALLAGDAPLLTPHSRQNGLAEEDLVRRGYQALTRSDAGVDAFVRRGQGLALFLQGHPEYDADTLAREYCRDVGRYLRNERPFHPATPTGYFDPDTEAALAGLAERARRKPAPELAAAYADTLKRASTRQTWRAAALQLYRNWLAHVAAAQRPAAASPAAL